MSLIKKKVIAKKALLIFFLIIMGITVNNSFAQGLPFFSSKKLKELESEYEKAAKENLELKVKSAKLQKDYEAISLDRDNLIIQAKRLLKEESRARELEGLTEKNKKDIEQLEKEKNELLAKDSELQENIKKLEEGKGQAVNEKKQLESLLAKERDKSPIKKLEDEKAKLQKEKNELSSKLKQALAEAEKESQAGSSKLKQALAEIARIKDSISKEKGEKLNLDKENNELKVNFKQTQAEAGKLKEGLRKANLELDTSKDAAKDLRQKLDAFNKKYAEAVKKNKNLEQRALDIPGKFVRLAQENKNLIKQTSNMHYNLGVFYTKNKEYSRAVAEFEEAVKLRPDDAYAHFNLGYIYAEYLVNRPKAIEHFRHYLRLAKKEDKDLDWVKKYILTWQAYAGREPME